MEKGIEASQKIKNITTILTSNPTLGYLPKENENTKSKRYKHHCVQCSSQDMEVPVDR